MLSALVEIKTSTLVLPWFLESQMVKTKILVTFHMSTQSFNYSFFMNIVHICNGNVTIELSFLHHMDFQNEQYLQTI